MTPDIVEAMISLSPDTRHDYTNDVDPVDIEAGTHPQEQRVHQAATNLRGMPTYCTRIIGIIDALCTQIHFLPTHRIKKAASLVSAISKFGIYVSIVQQPHLTGLLTRFMEEIMVSEMFYRIGLIGTFLNEHIGQPEAYTVFSLAFFLSLYAVKRTTESGTPDLGHLCIVTIIVLATKKYSAFES